MTRVTYSPEMPTPDLVDRACQLQRHTFVGGALALLAPTHLQIGLSVEAVHALVIDAGKPRAQQIVDAPVTKAPSYVRDLHNLLVQIHRMARSAGSCRGIATQAGTRGVRTNDGTTACHLRKRCPERPPHAQSAFQQTRTLLRSEADPGFREQSPLRCTCQSRSWQPRPFRRSL